METIYEHPATRLLAVVPNDGADLAFTVRALWIGGAGNLRVTAADDSGDVVLTGVPAGTLLPIAVKRVWATNTTATGIVALGMA